MKRLLTVVAALSLAVLAQGQNAAQKYVEQLKTTDELKEAVWGIKAVKAGGGTVAEFSRTTGTLAALTMNGKRIVSDIGDIVHGPRLEIERAFTDADD